MSTKSPVLDSSSKNDDTNINKYDYPTQVGNVVDDEREDVNVVATVDDDSNLLLLKRHFSTVGIGDVFLEPPPCDFLPWNYLQDHNSQRQILAQQQQSKDAQQSSSFLTWEIVGTIKATPQDFIVREIANSTTFNRIINIPGLSSEEIHAHLHVADLPDESSDVGGNNNKHFLPYNQDLLKNDHDNDCHESKQGMVDQDDDDAVESKLSTDEHIMEGVVVGESDGLESAEHGRDPSEAKGQSVFNEDESLHQTESTTSISGSPTTRLELSPREVLQKIIEHVYQSVSITPDSTSTTTASGNNAESIMSRLVQLEQLALTRIQDMVRQHSICKSSRREAEDPRRGDGIASDGILTSISLPMISSTATLEPRLSVHKNAGHSLKGGDRGEFHRALRAAFPLLKSEVWQEPLAGDNNDTTSQIRISMEDSLDELVPFLYQPQIDLPRLFQMRHGGCGRSSDQEVALRLDPSLPREQRRHIHGLLSRICPEFVRQTNPNYPLPLEEIATTGASQLQQHHHTAAIILKWSPRARQQHANRKRKRESKQPNSEDSDAKGHGTSLAFPNTFLCVMRKYCTEHLTAIKCLQSALRCRPSDIGLAGIKDRQAITYQFCTLRNVRRHQLSQANQRLSQFPSNSNSVRIGKFCPVDWQLNQGDLYGNRFDITVRDLRRVRVRRSPNCNTLLGGRAKEELVQCDRQHVLKMLQRIESQGFVNFYGDQRVGIPGDPNEVGVRSFDIGRAMLQGNFAKAIDLLMTGRTTTQDDASREAREVWRTSCGDAALTLKVMPHSYARERAVLQGLKRYGKDNPLAALKCLHYGIRLFWINAYQSYVWNNMATKRMELFGKRVVAGDLYHVGDKDGDGEVDVVQEAMADSVCLSQVVLPLPGYNIRYPENQIKEEYLDFMKNDGVSFDRHTPPGATAKGGYRRLVSAVENLYVTFQDDKDSPEFVQSINLKFDLKKGSYATSMLRELMLTTVHRRASADDNNVDS